MSFVSLWITKQMHMVYMRGGEINHHTEIFNYFNHYVFEKCKRSVT